MNDKRYIECLAAQFRRNSDPETALGQKAYMRNKFEFYGIKSSERRELLKSFLKKESLPPKEDLGEKVQRLWEMSEREYQYFAQELFFKYKKKLQAEDMICLEYMITHRSWWDTDDFIAVKLVGEYFKWFPEGRGDYTRKWIASGNIWLQRTAILFQLKYKEKTDTALLASTIYALLNSREFFINKAIGWVLREYSKTDPKWVVDLVENTELNRLSRMEALRLVRK